jgi:hypothetical protein
MVHEDSEDPLKVRLVQDQQPVEALRAGGAHEPLGDAVGLGRTKRRTNDLNPAAAEHLVKAFGEFLIAIANQKLQGFRALRQSPRQLARLLDDPGRARIRRAPDHMHTPATQRDEEEDVESLLPDRLDREEIDSQQALAVCPDELVPRHRSALARRAETSGTEPRAHGGC